MGQVVTIPSVHFDTNHISGITRWRHGRCSELGSRKTAYEIISRAVTGGFVKVLFSPSSCLEWVEGAKQPRQWEEICEFFETAGLVEEIESNSAYLLELIEETRRHFLTLRLPIVPMLRPVAEISPEFIQLAEHHPALEHLRGHSPIKSPGSRAGIRQCFEGSVRFAEKRGGAMKERIAGWRAAVISTRELFRSHKAKNMTQSAKVEWANRAQQLGEVLSSSDPEIDRKQLGDRLDFDRLPACSLYLNALWRYAKALGDAGPDDNDGDDWAQVPAIAYANYSLVENKLRNHLVTGTPSMASRIFSDPTQFAKALNL